MIEFTLPCRAFSVNRYHYRDKRHKTVEARVWEAEVLDLLCEHKELVDLAEDFKKDGKAFRVELTFEYPFHIFYNKAGFISSKSMDLSNVEKPLLDLIFGEMMDINDKYVVELLSRKQAGPTYAIKVKIELIR